MGTAKRRGPGVCLHGLTLQRTKHHLTIRGRDFYAWCAWDTLFLPELLGEPVAIESSCPVAGTSILLRVSPEGIEFIDPPGAMVTFVTPPDLCCDIDGWDSPAHKAPPEQGTLMPRGGVWLDDVVGPQCVEEGRLI